MRTAVRIADSVRVRHLFAIRALSTDDADRLLRRAADLQASREVWPQLDRAVVGLAFFEPSTRTRVGFHAAAARLGATAIDVGALRHVPGMTAPESLADTVRVLSAYCDVLVVRHPSEPELRAALAVSRVPVVNAGCGISEHPTQALVDLFAIRSHFGGVTGLRVGLVGALVRSRAASSLLDALAFEPPVELRLMAPAGFQPDAARLQFFKPQSVGFRDGLDVSGLDVLYVAGLPEGQGEHHVDTAARRHFQITPKSVRALAPGGIVLCPLPRVDEIASEVDGMPAAAYFAASDAGLFVRMALLEAYLRRPLAGAGSHATAASSEKTRCPQ